MWMIMFEELVRFRDMIAVGIAKKIDFLYALARG